MGKLIDLTGLRFGRLVYWNELVLTQSVKQLGNVDVIVAKTVSYLASTYAAVTQRAADA